VDSRQYADFNADRSDLGTVATVWPQIFFQDHGASRLLDQALEGGFDLSRFPTGLFQATHDPNGTSSSTFANFPVPIAGKTGTAEKVITLPGSKTSQVLNQSLWCGWGPDVSAKIVICVVIENGGHGGTAAAPAAAQVLAKFFNVKAPTTSKVSD